MKSTTVPRMGHPEGPTLGRRRVREAGIVIGVSTLVFLLFYFNAYFSDGFKGMLGYETKDTLVHLQSYVHAVSAGGSIYWDPYYLLYTPAFPQAPIYSPITRMFLIFASEFSHPSTPSFFLFYLLVLAAIQILCVYTMYLLLSSCGFSLLPALLGGLGYAYNHQTFVFGIRHGYERISALLLIPLVILLYFRLWQLPQSRYRYRAVAAGTALLLGLTLICNGDIKPTAFFMLFMVLTAIFARPFSWKNIAVLGLIFLLAGAIFAVQGLPTVYTFWDSVRGQESMEKLLEFSLRPSRLILTHISTAFTDRLDYPWESNSEYSLSFLLLVIVGLFSLYRNRWGRVIYATLIFSLFWIIGNYTPFRFVVGFIMRISGMHHPARMTILLYFCYSFALAQAVQQMPGGRRERYAVIVLVLIPVGLLIARGAGIRQIPLRFALFSLCSWMVIAGVTFRALPRASLWTLVLFFALERATPFVSLEESRLTDPTNYYTYGEIYHSHPRVEAILRDPEHRNHRAFFGGKEYPDLFSHTLYLNAFTDGIRPIFAYFVNEEWPVRIRQVQWLLLNDWSNPMWDILNVRYFVDLDALFITWDDEDVNRKGMERLEVVDRWLRVNPAAEGYLFLRYRAEGIKDEDVFISGLRDGSLDVKSIAYINSGTGDLISDSGPAQIPRTGSIKVIERRPDAVLAEVSISRPAILVFSEFWYFPWAVRINERPAELLRVYNILQGVKLSPGIHRVHFFFNFWHWKLLVPKFVSGSVILFLIAQIVFCWHKEKRIASPLPDSGKAQNPGLR